MNTISSITPASPLETSPGVWSFGTTSLQVGKTYRRGLGGRVLYTFLGVDRGTPEIPKLYYLANGEEATDYLYLNSEKTIAFITALVPSEIPDTPESLAKEAQLSKFVSKEAVEAGLGATIMATFEARSRPSSDRSNQPGQPVIHRKDLANIVGKIWGKPVTLAILNQVILQCASLLPQVELVFPTSKRQFIWLPAAYRIASFAKANPAWASMLTERAAIQSQESRRFNQKKPKATLENQEAA